MWAPGDVAARDTSTCLLLTLVEFAGRDRVSRGSRVTARHPGTRVDGGKREIHWGEVGSVHSSTPPLGMSRASKIFLGASFAFCGATIYGVHWLQQKESNVSG